MRVHITFTNGSSLFGHMKIASNHALDDVLRVDIGVLDSATAKITPTAVPNLFALMNSIDDFENSYKDFQAFK